jgi:hypothetical protein
MSGALSPPMASTASVNGPVTGESKSRRDPPSGPNGAPERLTCCDDFAPVVIATMATNVVRPLQFTAISAFRVGLMRQRLVTPPHPGARRRGFSLWYGHGTAPPSNDMSLAESARHDKIHNGTRNARRAVYQSNRSIAMAQRPRYRHHSDIFSLTADAEHGSDPQQIA